MLLSNVAAKSIRDRTPLATGIGIGLAIGAIGMIAMAASLQTQMSDLFDKLPAAFSGLIGGSGSNYVVTELFGLLAPIAILVVAVSGGINALAREENRRTANLLLTQPVTRRHVVVSGAAVVIANVALACALFCIGAMCGSLIVNVTGFGPSDAVAATTHLFFFGTAFAMIALAAGNVTGSASTGAGIAAAIAVASDVAVALLPLTKATSGAERFSPWHYYNGSNPLVNGVDIAHLVVLAVTAVIAFAIAVVVVDHRDMGSHHTGTLLARLPAIGNLVRPKVSSTFTKAVSERQVLVGVSAVGLAALAVGVSVMFTGLQSTLADLSKNLPDSLNSMIGNSDMGTPVGWIQAEMMSVTVPIVFVGVAIVIGIGAIAGEAEQHTLGLLVAGPMKRSRVVFDNAAALVVELLIVAVVLAAGLWFGSALGGLGLSINSIIAALVHVGFLAIFFGLLGLAVGAATTKRVATVVTASVAAACYLGDWALGLSARTEKFAVLSPWYYASHPRALANGVNYRDLAVLAALSALALIAAVVAFDRREITN